MLGPDEALTNRSYLLPPHLTDGAVEALQGAVLVLKHILLSRELHLGGDSTACALAWHPNALWGGQKGLEIHSGGAVAPLGHHPLLSFIFLLPPWSEEQDWSQDMAKPTTVVSTPADPRPVEPVPATCQNLFSGASPASSSCL